MQTGLWPFFRDQVVQNPSRFWGSDFGLISGTLLDHFGSQNGAKSEPENLKKSGLIFDIVLTCSRSPKWVILKALDPQIQVFRLSEVHFHIFSPKDNFKTKRMIFELRRALFLDSFGVQK